MAPVTNGAATPAAERYRLAIGAEVESWPGADAASCHPEWPTLGSGALVVPARRMPRPERPMGDA